MEMIVLEIINRLNEIFMAENIAQAVSSFIINTLVGLLTYLVYYAIWLVLDRMVRLALLKTHRDETTTRFIQTALKYVVLAVGVTQALSAAGVDTGALLASLGIAGLTIGFAARDSLSNLISGLLIFWDRPFVIGDLVEVEGNYGRVENITLRSTRVVTVDGRMLAVPNSVIVNTTIASYTNFPNIRLDIDVAIGLKEDVGRVRDILLSVATKDPDIMDDPAPDVVVTALNDYNLSLQLRAWLDDERKHIPKRFELREKTYLALREAGIDMPFETISINHLAVPEVPGAN